MDIIPRYAIVSHSAELGSGIVEPQFSAITHGVSNAQPVTEYQTTISSDEKPRPHESIIFVRLLVTAQESAAKRIIKSPRTLCSIGIPELGLQPTTTATPEIPTSSPTDILAEILCPNMGAASRTVKTGFMGMIRDASPAAVQLIPCMNNNW